MLRIRWRKVVRDLVGNKARTILVIAAITVGVFAVGLVASAQSILLRELNRGYVEANTSSATLYTDPFDDAMVARIERLPGVGHAEGRRTLRVKVLLDSGETRDLILNGIGTLPQPAIDKVLPLSGKTVPDDDELLIEGLAPPYLQTAVGETIVIELPDGERQTLTVAGTVYDANIPSPSAANFAFGYITLDGFAALGLGDYYTQLRYRVAEDATDLDHIHAVSATIEEQLERSGRSVYGIDTPPPGEHFAQDIIETMVLLFAVFGVLILSLSSFLAVNTINALLAQQVQQIGVMKLVGARQPQIMTMYFVMVVAYGVIALAIGVPLGVVAARNILTLVVDLINLRIVDNSVPFSVIALQLGVGLLIPLGAALWPVVTGVRVTTHKALNSLGIGAETRRSWVDRAFVRLQRLLPVERPLMIALRNTFRKKGRLILTLLTLTLATALFIAVLSVRTSVQQTIDGFLRYHGYDVSVTLTNSQRVAEVESLVQQLPGVTLVESWLTASARQVLPDGEESESITLTALPADTAFVSAEILSGRWLSAADQNALVVNTTFVSDISPVAPGDDVTLRIDGRDSEWRVVGIVPGEGDFAGATVFAVGDPFARLTRQAGKTQTLKVATERHDAAYQAEMARLLTEQLEAAGMEVSRTRTTEAIRESNEFLFNLVIGFLVLMAVLLATVGGLGLTTTMSINVLERIREIGVLRAIGASDGAVRRIVVSEGIFIGVLSWLVGSGLALPFGRILSDQVGMALLGFPLSFRFAVAGMLIWLVAIIVLAVAASLGPARNAARLTIREVLAYE